MDHSDYKRLQETWVSGHSGGQLYEIVAVTSVLISCYSFWLAFLSTRRESMALYIKEYVLFIMPVLISYGWPHIGMLLLAIMLVSSLIYCKFTHTTADTSKKDDNKLQELSLNSSRKPFLGVYKASIMIYTCAAILAVDFPLFPRRFAKTETFGISLMDVGVGCFVFAQGVVFGKYMNVKATLSTVKKALISSLPLLVLGFARLAAVKSTDYQEHVSEYGVHWNFFFTLAFIPPFVAIGQLFNVIADSGVIGLVIICVYEYVLQVHGLQDYIINAPRTNLISANREGICSLFGYVSIFFFAGRLGQLLFQPNRKFKDWKAVVLPQLVKTCILLWTFYAILSNWLKPSRRMVNFMYVLCLVAHGVYSITACLFLQLYFPATKTEPHLMASINRNQLVIFLIANLLTGMVNMSMRTLFASDIVGFSVLMTYFAVISTFAFILDKNLNLTVKFW